MKITINTSKGAIDVTLFPEDAPVTVASFLHLASRGFYDGLSFHRVIPNFMIQGGCPLGTGTGDPGYKFECECKPNRKHDKPGMLSMANAGPNTNGSQFFICHDNVGLPNAYTIFGEVTEGLDVVDTIAQNPTGPQDRPIEPVTINSVTITES